MNTKDTVRRYFENLHRGDWESLLDDDIAFSSNGTEAPRGKKNYVDATRRFLQVAKAVDVKQLIVEGDKASAITSYTLRSPNGNASVCDVAEIFSVKNGRIESNSIFFDLAAFREFMARG